MIIKKFEAASESEAILKAKEELGNDAIVMNIKTMKPKGLFKMFRKTNVEVMAAVDERGQAQAAANSDDTVKQSNDISAEVLQDLEILKNMNMKEKKETSAIEKKLDMLADMLEKKQEDEKEEILNEDVTEKAVQEDSDKNRIQALLLNQLLNNEVDEEYANMLIKEMENVPYKEDALDTILANVYQRIVLKLGQPQVIDTETTKTPRVCFFVGSTGVGKTTTIAKIASMFKLERKAKVALVTSDTYRIAAVEQLKTYANILSLPIRVVYSPKEIKKAFKDYKGYDLIIVDTAGRSHKNTQQCDELKQLITSIPEENREVYLVMSATTKYKDMLQITERYRDIDDYRIVFTKLDETSCYGNILNIRMATKAPLSYVTCGQVVPDDIETLNAQAIAKQLIGGCE